MPPVPSNIRAHPFVAFNNSIKRGTIGLPVSGTDMKVVDVETGTRELPPGETGELCISGPQVMKGYWNKPDESARVLQAGADGRVWFHTGDIGCIDSDDFLFFVDRRADYLRRRGENIASFEVERILMRHGELADVVVHAVFSELGEDDLKITATRAPVTELSEADLFRWCIDELPYFALPRYIEFRGELPRSPVGRVLKRVLREEGVTATTWAVDDSGISFEKR